MRKLVVIRENKLSERKKQQNKTKNQEKKKSNGGKIGNLVSHNTSGAEIVLMKEDLQNGIFNQNGLQH